MKKALGQTVRDLRREVNKKVLKVPSIEQKVLDATSNEPWGPHGTVLSDISQASRNYHEYQMIMAVIWKRINDTGKNWRHVYKALTVLEYMVANGTERVIEDIREHAYQIQTLSDFQYIDSSGRDQGNNVRKKSQSLVVLVNDKERIVEVRQKAAANQEKYCNTNSGNIYRAGSYSGSGGFEDEHDGRYGSRDEDRNGYGKDREYGYRDDDRYGDSNGRDGYKDDESRGRSRCVVGNQYGSRSRSADRDRDHSYEEDSQHSSSSQDGSNLEKRLERKFSEQSIGAPPSYEDAVGVARSPTYSEQGGEILSASSPASYSSPANAGQDQAAHSSSLQPAISSPPASSSPLPNSNQKEPDNFDEFDPRGSFKAMTVASNSSPQNGAAEIDFLGSLSESFSSNALALVPSEPATSAPGPDAFGDSGSGISSSLAKEAFDDPFGDGPFKAFTSTDHLPAQNTTSGLCPPQMIVQRQESMNSFSHLELPMPDHDIDILADILPPTSPQVVTSSHTSFQPQANNPSSQAGNYSQAGQIALQTGVNEQPSQLALLSSFSVQPGQPFLPAGIHYSQHLSQHNLNAQTTQSPSSTGFIAPAGHVSQTGFPSQSGQPTTSFTSFPVFMDSSPHTSFQAHPIQQHVPFSGSYGPQMDYRGPFAPQMSSQVFAGPSTQPSSVGLLAQPSTTTSSQITPPQGQPSYNIVPQTMVPASMGFLTSAAQPVDDKFKTKSIVWADTLSRGLVNLNISGSKTNPLSDIGVDFDAINRKEKRMEKPSTAPSVSNITMGRAMGAGSGLGRAGAGVLRPISNPMGMGSGTGMAGGPRPAIGMGGYGAGAVNQPMGMNMAPNMGFGQGGHQMQQPGGFPYGPTMPPGGYNPMSGRGNYGQQPYGGGYR